LANGFGLYQYFTMSAQRNYILDAEGIQRKIERLAYEIAEQNAGAASIIITGIAPNGVLLAQKLKEQLAAITQQPVALATISLDKKHPEAVQFDPALPLNGETIILADDVSMTGRTMMYALKPLLQQHPHKIQTLVLVERQQKRFPMHSDYVGMYVSTTLQELIMVEAEGAELTGAYLV
jgi:pyrimidine operon attenuation protein / uracil phosphoribosyltransferase